MLKGAVGRRFFEISVDFPVLLELEDIVYDVRLNLDVLLAGENSNKNLIVVPRRVTCDFEHQILLEDLYESFEYDLQNPLLRIDCEVIVDLGRVLDLADEFLQKFVLLHHAEMLLEILDRFRQSVIYGECLACVAHIWHVEGVGEDEHVVVDVFSLDQIC